MSHTHCYGLKGIKQYYDPQKGCMVKRVMFCCDCGKKYNAPYEYRPPPRKQKSCKALEKNKRKYSNRK